MAGVFYSGVVELAQRRAVNADIAGSNPAPGARRMYKFTFFCLYGILFAQKIKPKPCQKETLSRVPNYMPTSGRRFTRPFYGPLLIAKAYGYQAKTIGSLNR